jgi:hypothetical protein
MQFVAILTLEPQAAEDAQAKLRRAEVQKVWELTVSGALRSIHFFSGEGRGAILHLEASDLRAAQAAVERLPMVGAGLLRAAILSLTPFTGLAALFAQESA